MIAKVSIQKSIISYAVSKAILLGSLWTIPLSISGLGSSRHIFVLIPP